MKMFVTLLVACSLMYGTKGTFLPFNFENSNGILLRAEPQTDFYGNTKHLIEELVSGLRSAASQAAIAVGNFTIGMQDQVKFYKDQLIYNVNQLSERVETAIHDLNKRLQDTSEAVSECVTSYETKAEALFTETINKTTVCVDKRIEEISILITELNEKSTAAMAAAETALQELHSCTHENTGNLLTTSSCLGTVLVRTEVKAAVFVGQSGLLIARINLALATLPASLEVCAGARLVEAGLKTSQLVIDVSRCSISSAMNNLISEKN